MMGFALIFAHATAFPQSPDDQAIRQVIATYAHSIDTADPEIASQIWSTTSEVSFIHPRGEEHALGEILADVYVNLMAGTFSKRELSPKGIMVHVYGDTAWSEFQWDFVATVRADGSAFESQGRESQIYHKENGVAHRPRPLLRRSRDRQTEGLLT